MKIKNVLEKIAAELGGEVRGDYSGRCMFGRRCYGITTPDPTACVMLAGRFGLPRPSQDNMGLDFIIYWPDFDEAAVDQEAPSPDGTDSYSR